MTHLLQPIAIHAMMWVALGLGPAELEYGPDTTVISQPRQVDGVYVDYVAAFDAIRREGVNTRNNAAIPLMLAMGPDAAPHRKAAEFYRHLGIDPLPAQGSYLRDLAAFNYVSDPDAPTSADLERRLERPWSPADHPAAAAWIEANAQPLTHLHEAARRGRFYMPAVTAEDPPTMIGVLLPSLGKMRTGARLLGARAMMLAQAGRIDEAWDDLEAALRIGRLVSQDRILISHLVGISIEALALDRAHKLLAETEPTDAQLQRMDAALAALPPRMSFLECIAFERWMALDAVSMVMRSQGRELLNVISPSGPSASQPDLVHANQVFMRVAPFDPNVILRRLNHAYAQMEAVHRHPTYRLRREAGEKYEAQLTERRSQHARLLTSPAYYLAVLAANPARRRAKFSEAIGDLFVSVLLPALGRASEIDTRVLTQYQLTVTAVALERHRLAHGRYPETLGDLDRRIIARPPTDPFTGEAFTYRRQPGGYLLYSFGSNLRDDVGDPDSRDDIVVTVASRREVGPSAPAPSAR